jgi:hypothetical protein
MTVQALTMVLHAAEQFYDRPERLRHRAQRGARSCPNGHSTARRPIGKGASARRSGATMLWFVLPTGVCDVRPVAPEVTRGQPDISTTGASHFFVASREDTGVRITAMPVAYEIDPARQVRGGMFDRLAGYASALRQSKGSGTGYMGCFRGSQVSRNDCPGNGGLFCLGVREMT